MAKAMVQPMENGVVRVWVEVPPVIWALAGQMASEWEVPQLNALRIILKQVAIVVEDTNANVLGSMFKPAYATLLARDAIPSEGMPPIDVGKLHRSNKTKSGFVGVYANGQGFRSMAKVVGEGRVQKSIGTFRTAEQAAWARYLHYKKHKLAYGELEEIADQRGGDVQHWRDAITERLGRDPTDLEVLSQVNEARVDSGAQPLPVPKDIVLPPPTYPLPRGWYNSSKAQLENEKP